MTSKGTSLVSAESKKYRLEICSPFYPRTVLIHEAGRRDKYLVDLGWEQNMRVYVIYGCTGDTKQAINCTEAIIEAIEEEIAKDPLFTILIVGDFNHTPNEVHNV